MNISKLSNLEEERRHLIEFIEHNSPQGSSNNSVTIVFDGSQDCFGTMSSHSAKIVFTQGESADDKIKDIVTKADNAKNIMVVSDDRSVQYAVRALGAQTSSVRAFLGKTHSPKGKSKARKRTKNSSSVSEKYISKTDESKITTEMGDIWLKSDDQ